MDKVYVSPTRKSEIKIQLDKNLVDRGFALEKESIITLE